MILSVRNAKNRKLTKLLKTATVFFANKLMSKKLTNNICIRIVILDEVYAGAGFCLCEDSVGKQRNFLIELHRSRNKLEMIFTLAHEMVHVKQMARNELRDKSIKSRTVTTWMGQEYDDNTEYWDHPWELEAYGLERGLVAKFLLEYNKFRELHQTKKEWFF